MNRLFSVALLFLFSFSVSFSQEIVDQYLDEYQYIAVSEMERTGIPASIKLAQGLLESSWGQSELSNFAHNHFGIKCGGSWEGQSYYKIDDDLDENGELRESCFRVFTDDQASYVAHSEFLLTNKRYAFLFDYSETDYKAWAKGLRKAGYATDPSYPSKLIGIIKKYDLARFDYMAADEIELLAGNKLPKVEEEEMNAEEAFIAEVMENEEELSIAEDESKTYAETETNKSDNSGDFTKNGRKSSSTKRKKKSFKFDLDNLMKEVIALGEEILDQDQSKQGKITSFPNLKERNGVEMVLSEENESLEDVASRTGISVNKLQAYNDFTVEAEGILSNGSTIYIQKKKSSFTGNRKKHQVRSGETIATISQRYGVTESSLRKRNYIGENEELKHGELLYLRGLRTIQKPKVKTSIAKNNDQFLFESEAQTRD